MKAADPAAAEAGKRDAEDDGYERSLTPRQMRMIAIGGAIGTGLFLGAGARLAAAGPALAIAYLVAGIFAFLIMRALGELVMHRPTSGSFVAYAREFLGERGAYVAGWLYYLNWAMTGIVEITGAALYMRYWPVFAAVPQWVFALVALCIVGAANLVAVRWFGELEFWFSTVKVTALVAFLLLGVALLASGHPVGGQAPGPHLVAENGGMFPHGLVPALVMIQGVVFAYSGIEMVGIAAGEAQDPERIVPAAINGVIWRIGLFYVGSVILLVLLLPWTAYRAGISPFVTFFQALGVPGAATAMNLVILTAALSSLNSGLYSTGRVLRALAIGGSAPRMLARMSAARVPAAGIALTLAVYLVGVGLNYLLPAQVFELALSIASVGVVSTWAFIVVCQMKLRRAVARGEVAPVTFRMPLAPVTGWLTLAFLAGVIGLMGFDYPNGTAAVAAIPVLALLLLLGWRVRADTRASESSASRP